MLRVLRFLTRDVEWHWGKEIGRQVNISSWRIYRLLTKLEDAGLVERKQVEDGRHFFRARMTDTSSSHAYRDLAGWLAEHCGPPDVPIQQSGLPVRLRCLLLELGMEIARRRQELESIEGPGGV